MLRWSITQGAEEWRRIMLHRIESWLLGGNRAALQYRGEGECGLQGLKLRIGMDSNLDPPPIRQEKSDRR